MPALGLDVRVYYTPPKFADGTVLVCHHGAGSSALSFACTAKEITDMSRGQCGVLALDCRGHGASVPAMGRDGREADGGHRQDYDYCVAASDR